MLFNILKNNKKLKEVDFNLNVGLRKLPEEILYLDNLEKITLSNTRIKKDNLIVRELKNKGVIVFI
ncbi:MAG TPA: hypothetical protein VJ912_00930 [Candidatus Nanoarchaeia archaeon]|nr:hypothetical protein [Candidatus Nanoarchaeia archaeon]